MMRIGMAACGLLLGLSAMVAATAPKAATMTGTLPSGLTVSADYHRGERGRPAVLVLHGFLTTCNFNTVRRVAVELAGEGYSVLAPTLSLNVDGRRASTPCDAIHTHTWEDDLAEIDYWVRWLMQRGHDSIVLLGHSTGSLQLVSYAARRPPEAVQKVVATSLVNFRRYTEEGIAAREMALARQLAAGGQSPLHGYHLVFCENYTATPESYLSYIDWTPARVLAALRQSRVPVEVIMGGEDRRFGGEWVKALRGSGIPVRVIEGADHFFGATTEFELMDAVRRALETIE